MNDQLEQDVAVIRDQLIPSLLRSGGYAYVETLTRLLALVGGLSGVKPHTSPVDSILPTPRVNLPDPVVPSDT